MKKIELLLVFLSCLLVFSAVGAQTDQVDVISDTETGLGVQRMVWNADGTSLTIVKSNSVERIAVSGETVYEKYPSAADLLFLSASEDGLAAAVSTDRQTIFLYEPDAPEKAMVSIEPGFETLSVSLSVDGTQLLADSAEEIRTVVYKSVDGEKLYDLKGFQTAAPVYDSVLSLDGKYVLWHSRGTFALQNISDESFGKTISLWDFASAYELAPDNRVLAVGIINEDYENGAVLFFDPLSGEELGRTILGKNAPYAISYSQNGSALWAADSNSVYLIDPKSFELKDQAEVFLPDSDDDRIIRVAASPDGDKAALLTSSGKLILAH